MKHREITLHEGNPAAVTIANLQEEIERLRERVALETGNTGHVLKVADEYEEEIGRLRAALIECGRAAGAPMTDDVSTDFLMHVPAEVRAVMSDKREQKQ